MMRSQIVAAILSSVFITLTWATTPPVLSLSIQTATPTVKPTHKTEEKVEKARVYSMDIETDIHLRYATTKVTSRVANPQSNATEAVFNLVLPDTAFISGFLMEIEGKVYEALVKEKEEAQKEYDSAVSSGQTAAQVSSSARDANQFVVSVNIEPHSKVTFNLTYEQLLTRRRGVYEHTVHINPGTVVPQLSVRTNIFEVLPISNVKVLPLENEIGEILLDKKAKIVNVNATMTTIVFEPSAKEQKKVSENGIGGQLTVQYDVDRSSLKQKGGEIHVVDGYFVHFFAPSSLPTLPKHVVFVLDTSGSMQGVLLEQTKQAMVSILDQLHPKDIFSIIEFSSSSKEWDLTGNYKPIFDFGDYYVDPEDKELATTAAPTDISEEKIGDYDDIFAYPVTELSVSRAKSFVRKMEATGGTNINDALVQALKNAQTLKSRVKRTPIIIFLTDGEATEGVTNSKKIIANVKRANSDQQVSIFSLAFGTGADFSLLKEISNLNRGFARKIYEGSDATLQLQGFYDEVASPLLSDVSFNYQGGVSEVSETQVPILFNGTEWCTFGRVQDSIKVNVDATGLDGPLTFTTNQTDSDLSGAFPYWLEKHVPEKDEEKTKSFSLEKMWAYSTIKHLLKQSEADQDDKSFKEKALNLSLSYGFVTPLTSLLVIKPNATATTTVTNIELQLLTTPNDDRTLQVSRPNLYPGFGSGANFASPPFAPIPISVDIAQLEEEIFTTEKAITTTTVSATEEPTTNYTEVDRKQLISDWINNFPHNETHVSIALDNNTTYSLVTTDNLLEYDINPCNSTSDPNAAGLCRSMWSCDLDIIQPYLKSRPVVVDRICILEDNYIGFCCY